MNGETDLAALLRGLTPDLDSSDYVYVTTKSEHQMALFQQHAIGMFIEKEGVTYILPVDIADRLCVDYSTTFAKITCTIHSSLEAVGLTSAISAALAEIGVSANVVAAYYHDHIFVPSKDKQKALNALRSISS